MTRPDSQAKCFAQRLVCPGESLPNLIAGGDRFARADASTRAAKDERLGLLRLPCHWEAAELYDICEPHRLRRLVATPIE
jgi:hypothetical protein